MSTDSNIKIAPIMQAIAQLGIRESADRTARILVFGGMTIAGLAALIAIVVTALAYHDPALSHLRETVGSLCFFIGIICAVISGAGLVMLHNQKGHRVTRAGIKIDVRETITSKLAAAERERLRHEIVLKEMGEETIVGIKHLEKRVDDSDRRLDADIRATMAAVVRVGDQMGRVERVGSTVAEFCDRLPSLLEDSARKGYAAGYTDALAASGGSSRPFRVVPPQT